MDSDMQQMRQVRSQSSDYIGIDLGTSNTYIYTPEHGVCVREPSAIAYEKKSGRVIAAGSEAKKMIDKTPAEIAALCPLSEGVVSDFDFAVMMLRDFVKKAGRGMFASRPRAVVCLPCGVSEVEKRAVEDVCLEAGMKSVSLIEEPMAAAIGAGLPVMSGRGSMIVNIGGGTTEIAVVVNGGIANYTSSKVSGTTFDDALAAYIKREFNVAISRGSAETVKIIAGSANVRTDRGIVDVRGRNISTGLPAEINLYSQETREAYADTVSSLVEAIRYTVENTPPELCGDICDSGIALSGGGALLPGLEFTIGECTKQKVYVAKRPQECVINGIAEIIDRKELRPLLEGEKFDTGVTVNVID